MCAGQRGRDIPLPLHPPRWRRVPHHPVGQQCRLSASRARGGPQRCQRVAVMARGEAWYLLEGRVRKGYRRMGRGARTLGQQQHRAPHRDGMEQ